jgi:hypothetical protein
VDPRRLELLTSSVSRKRSNQLSYGSAILTELGYNWPLAHANPPVIYARRYRVKVAL